MVSIEMMLTPQAVRSECVQLAAIRAAALVHQRLARGLNSLISIAWTASWVGLLVTIRAFVGSFKGISGDCSMCARYMAKDFSEALIPAAVGFVVAIQAAWTYNYLRDKIETLDLEMQ